MSLKTLRADPAAACQYNVYRTGPAEKHFTDVARMVEGGRCTIGGGAASGSANVYDLKATANNYNSTDYFFPWLRTGIGWVKVPKAVADGSIVMTGGVNGCTLVVTEFGTDWYFYHDGDSKYLKPADLTGNEVARVAPNDYDPNGIGQQAFQNALAQGAAAKVKPVGDVSYGHFVVSVKKDGRFGMYVTGVMSFNGLTRLPSGPSVRVAEFG